MLTFMLDVHPCENRYSREARVHGLPFDKNYTSCEEFELLFPDAFPGMTEETAKKIIPEEDKTKKKIWYSWKSGGLLSTKLPIKFLIDFTIRYDSLIAAEQGNEFPKQNSEFSLRVWKNDIDLQYLPREKDLIITYKLYKQMLNRFGSYGEFPCEKMVKEE